MKLPLLCPLLTTWMSLKLRNILVLLIQAFISSVPLRNITIDCLLIFLQTNATQALLSTGSCTNFGIRLASRSERFVLDSRLDLHTYEYLSNITLILLFL